MVLKGVKGNPPKPDKCIFWDSDEQTVSRCPLVGSEGTAGWRYELVYNKRLVLSEILMTFKHFK